MAITVLGKTFPNEEERREYYRNELSKKLPELKHIDGFPIGEDEDIIALSDPPYYTACPNPWLNDFIERWEREKDTIAYRKKDFDVDEPYASDVSEGKNNPIYNAHSYHTKVPHPAIMRYLLHYTQPGDIVFDGFAGTGMTGVATKFINKPDKFFKIKIEQEFNAIFGFQPTWGQRRSICSDLSPIASFLAYNYNSNINAVSFESSATSAIKNLIKDIGWMWQTKHTDGGLGVINFVVYSDVYICPNCNNEFIFWDVALNDTKTEFLEEFKCNSCGSLHTKKTIEKSFKSVFDSNIGAVIKQIKTVPVEISYSYKNRRYTKTPDVYDGEIIEKINDFNIQGFIPKDLIPKGDKLSEALNKGNTNVHHFFTKRQLATLSSLNSLIGTFNSLKMLLTGVVNSVSKMYRWTPNYEGGGPMSGTIYFPSIYREISCIDAIERFSKKLPKVFALINESDSEKSIIQNSSATDFSQLKSDSIDYIFTDPPFGANIMYSELSLLWESWLKIKTNNKCEAIENKSQGKTLLAYQELMTRCFTEYFRILKSGKWMTVEFSNTSAEVWNGIQVGLQKAGFIIANVAGLDKKQGSFNAINNPTSVKQDLVISCYKPSKEFENNFRTERTEVAIWDFVIEHLHHLPVHIKKDNSTTAIIERSPKILFDRLITFYLMRGLQVPIDAGDFQEVLKERFSERDGMYFSAEQAAEYDEKKAKTPKMVQQELFVGGESDAIEWLKERLRKTPQKYQDIMPDFRKAPQAIRKGDSIPELNIILEQNFIQDAEGKWRTPNPNEIKDRDALRNKALIKEFNGYISLINQPKAKKLKEVRLEALRAGFKHCWEQKDFKTIVTLGDMVPQNILLGDEQLLMYYDIAKDKI